MNIQQAKAIPIAEILERMGQLPSKQSKDESWYKSPIRDEKTASFHVLENYLSDRGIPITIGARYLKELRIHNHETGNHFIALGFKNEDEGYEIRNKRFKGSVKAKNISFIRGSIPGNKEIHIFEGVFDFLTAITQNEGKHFDGDVIVLNSIAMLSRATPYLKGYGYKVLYSWMDNDESGKRATVALQEFSQTEEGLQHIPMNDRYAPYKDVNAAHMAKLGLSME